MKSHPDYLTVGSTKFARTSALLTASLFHKGGTANGTYKVRKNGILFLNAKGEPFAFLVANRHGERFFVSCCTEGNGIRYGYGLADWDKALLGLSGYAYRAMQDEPARIWESLTADLVPA
jgi:hypothetical protein